MWGLNISEPLNMRQCLSLIGIGTMLTCNVSLFSTIMAPKLLENMTKITKVAETYSYVLQDLLKQWNCINKNDGRIINIDDYICKVLQCPQPVCKNFHLVLFHLSATRCRRNFKDSFPHQCWLISFQAMQTFNQCSRSFSYFFFKKAFAFPHFLSVM